MEDASINVSTTRSGKRRDTARSPPVTPSRKRRVGLLRQIEAFNKAPRTETASESVVESDTESAIDEPVPVAAVATVAVSPSPEKPSVAAVAVSPSPAKESGDAETKEPRRSGRARAEIVRLYDPTDGSELEEGRGRKRKAVSDTYRPVIKAITKGDRICRKFFNEASGKEEYYWGVVGDGPFTDAESGTVTWIINYDDGDKEMMEKKDVLVLIQFEEARRELCTRMGTTVEEVLAALEEMEPPYGLNEAMRLIHTAKQDPRYLEDTEEEFKKFAPEIGLKIRKNFDGRSYNGKVVSGPDISTIETGEDVRTWRVQYEDGDQDDMEYFELFQWRSNRPSRPHPWVGRQMCFLELFSGQGIVTQAFAERKFRVQSIDNYASSAATMMVDIMEIQYEDIGMVPDVIWASPPCSTYSRLSGTVHRDPKEGNFEKSEEARQHNLLLLQMKVIIEWTMKKNPHLIVVIENPEAMLRQMPLMHEIENQLGLQRTTVHYCAFGATEKKPTNLWSNDLNLLSRLGQFKCCNERCPYYKLGNQHPRGARGNKSNYDTALVPSGLAELVATYADSKLFLLDRVPDKKEVVVTEEDIVDLNERLHKELI